MNDIEIITGSLNKLNQNIMNSDEIIDQCLKRYTHALNEAIEANQLIKSLINGETSKKNVQETINKMKLIRLEESCFNDLTSDNPIFYKLFKINNYNDGVRFCLYYEPDFDLEFLAGINATRNDVKGNVLYIGGRYDLRFIKYWNAPLFTYIDPTYEKSEQKGNLQLIKGLAEIINNECVINEGNKITKLPFHETIIIKCAATHEVYTTIAQTMKPPIIMDFYTNIDFTKYGYKDISYEISKLKPLMETADKINELVYQGLFSGKKICKPLVWTL